MSSPEYQKQWRLAHKQHLKEYLRRRYEAKKEAILKRQKERYNQNKAEILAKQKAYVERNKERIYARQAEYQKRKPEVWKRNTKAYEARYPERVKASKKKWQDAHRLENRMKCQARRAKMKGLMSEDEYRDSLNFYKWLQNQEYVSCSYCGTFVSGRLIHIDHIVPVSRNGRHNPNNFCVSCRDCNLSKADYMLMEWPRCPERIKQLLPML